MHKQITQVGSQRDILIGPREWQVMEKWQTIHNGTFGPDELHLLDVVFAMAACQGSLPRRRRRSG